MNNFKKLNNNYNLSCFRTNIFKAMILHLFLFIETDNPNIIERNL